MIVKRIIFAVSFAVLAGAAFAAGDSNPPLDAPIPGIRDPLNVHDPLMDSPSRGASLPELPGPSDGSKMFRDMQPLPLPGERAPLVEPYPERPEAPGPRPYWENDPLFNSSAMHR
jgi:hypothetical protein